MPERNKRGPGRMHKRRSQKASLRMATGPGSINCENEIRDLVHAGDQIGAINLYEANCRVMFQAGENRGIPRLHQWYLLAKSGNPTNVADAGSAR